MRTICFTICWILGGFEFGFSQSFADIEHIKNQYNGEAAVVINDIVDVNIDVQDDKYKISEDVTKETLILKDTKSYLAKERILESSFNKISQIDAKTLIPEGKKFKTIRVEKIIDQKDQDESIFYDEDVAKCFVYPSVQPGAITSLKYKSELANKFMLGTFFFKWFEPCVFSQLNIKADKRAKIKFALFNVDSANIEFTTKEKGNYRFYSWTSRNINKAVQEQDAPNIRYFFPHIVYTIDNTYPSDTINPENKGIKGLYHYYCGFVKYLNQKNEKPIEQLVDSITSHITEEEEKVRRIYYWVQDNINYVAFEEGMQGFIPESAIQVFNKRYGDCKGMASILNYMLHLAGINSYLTWVGTVDLPYKYTDIASEITDNHMIVTYYKNDTPVFLDATNNYGLFGMPSSMIQGKQALVAIDSDNFRIEVVPVIDDSINTIKDSLLFTIDNGTIKGRGSIAFTGYEKNEKSYKLNGKDKIETKEKIIDLVRVGNNKFFVDSFQIENLDNRENPLNIRYNFRMDDYYKEIDNEIYLNLNLDRNFDNGSFDAIKRKIPVATKYKTEFEYIDVFEIPQGYAISNMPHNSEFKSDMIDYQILYSIEGNKLIRRNVLRSKFLLLQPGEFIKWNSVIDSLSKAYREVLILRKV